MSLLGSVSCFVNGTSAELSVLRQVIEGRFGHTNSTLLIGIALLIFGYGIYELVISDIDPRQQEPSTVRRNLLNIESLDGLNQKLTKVIVVALIVTANELLMSCAGVIQDGCNRAVPCSHKASSSRAERSSDQRRRPSLDRIFRHWRRWCRRWVGVSGAWASSCC